MLPVHVLLIVALTTCSGATCVNGYQPHVNESVLKTGANGSAVVLLSIASIKQAAIFSHDNELLRRIAYVETRDGSNVELEAAAGGIWAVDENAFERTKADTTPLLKLKHEQIRSHFGIDWSTVRWSELQKPLLSALAASLVLFLAPRPIPNHTDRAAQALFWKETYNREGSLDEFIEATTELQGSFTESSGSEFYVGFPRNIAGARQRLFITTKEPNPVPFTVRAVSGLYFTGIAVSNETTVVDLGNSYQIFNGSDRNKGIHVTAGNRTLVVYGLNYQQYTSDAFLALPCPLHQLGVEIYEYYGMTYGNTSGPNQFLFVGCEDNTTISVGSSTIVLHQMETYLHEVMGDHTGMRFVSNKPVSFFSGHLCTYVPRNDWACDHLNEQLPPTAAWGTRFLTSPFSGRVSGDIYRILTSAPSTVVNIFCSDPTNTVTFNSSFTLISAGAWREVAMPANSFCAMESNNPLLVVQFGLAHTSNQIGDPFMIMITSVEQYSNKYTFNVLSEFSENYITILVTPDFFQPENILVDGNNLEHANWTTIYCHQGNVCGHVAYASMEEGEHHLYHTNTVAVVGVLVYGFNSFNSYGYPGGLQHIPTQLATVSFSQEEYTVGESERRVTVSIVRSRNTTSSIVIMIASHPSEGSATVGQDYTPVVQVVEFQSGVLEREVEVEIMDDDIIEVEEVLTLHLSSGIDAYLHPNAQAQVRIVDNDGTIDIVPHYGNQLGGTPHLVSGTGVVFRESDYITCMFDDQRVKGMFLNEKQTLCVSPRLPRTGTVLFHLIVEHPHPKSGTFSGQTDYSSLPFQRGFEVYLESSGPVLGHGDVVTVIWSPFAIFPLTYPDSYTVDITLHIFDFETKDWNIFANLASDVPHTGEATVAIPELASVYSYTDSLLPIVIGVGVSSASVTNNSSKVLSQLGRDGTRIVKYSPVRFAKQIHTLAVQRLACEAWAKSQPADIGQQLSDHLPPCPCTRELAAVPTSGFIEEIFSSTIPYSNEGFDKYSHFTVKVLTDNSFLRYFHDEASSCYRQRIVYSHRSLSGSSGQQCCYDEQGHLIVGSPGGGSADTTSPDVSFTDHLTGDVVPLWLCCKAGVYSHCGQYFQHRPSDDCSRSIPPLLPGWVIGDPHILTLDGHRYTFNGRGEFTLITTPDNSFTLQGRMVDTVSSGNTVSAAATVFSAIVAREWGSDTVQFETAEDAVLLARVNGEIIRNFIFQEYEFRNVVVTKHGDDSLSATFRSGAYIQVRKSNRTLSSVLVSLPDSYKATGIRGLLGSFNENAADDLLPKLEEVPLPLSSSPHDVHMYFGLTWLIDIPVQSMFSYELGRSWITYYDPFFSPVYKPVFNNTDLETEATRLCKGDELCMFDAAATGNIEVGVTTLQSNVEIRKLLKLFVPIECDPPCENGACVANNTCACSEGFKGDTCTEKLLMTCEDSPCENGGTCSRHVRDYMCICREGHSGSLCQETDQFSKAYGSLVAGLIFIVMVVVFLATTVGIVAWRSYKHPQNKIAI